MGIVLKGTLARFGGTLIEGGIPSAMDGMDLKSMEVATALSVTSATKLHAISPIQTTKTDQDATAGKDTLEKSRGTTEQPTVHVQTTAQQRALVLDRGRVV